MSIRVLFAGALVAVQVGCGGDSAAREVRLLAPVGIATDVTGFEQETGCRVDLRVYDEGEDIAAIARRRNADAIAGLPRGDVFPMSSTSSHESPCEEASS